MGDTLKRNGALTLWLREGILSGTATGVVRGFTDIVFFPAFAFCYGWQFLIKTTTFDKILSEGFQDRMDGYLEIAVLALIVCAVASMLCQRSIVLAVLEALLLQTGYMNWKHGGHKYYLFILCVLVVSATGRSFRMVLSIAFAVGAVLTAAAFAASQAGIIEDLVYKGGRHSYGIIYCTDCAAHILFLLLIYAMLRLESLHPADLSVLFAGLALMWGTGGKTDLICAVILTAGLACALLYRYRLADNDAVNRVLRWGAAAACLSFPLCAAFSFAVTMRLETDSLIIRLLGHTLKKRLELGLRALKENPFSLYGTSLHEVGFGGKTTDLPGWDTYFFVDCSYVRLYVIGGALLFAMLLLALTFAQIRCFRSGRYGYSFLLVIVSMVCIMEHHLMEYYYNVFVMMAFSGGAFFRGKEIRRRLEPPSGQDPEADTQEYGPETDVSGHALTGAEEETPGKPAHESSDALDMPGSADTTQPEV